ncbi:MAG: bifunctional 4-hydroxy-2-oxoglutarate aldolase/2-dehydro-3-deoxy-phosphogluconate aldolase [Bauldia sp.]|nr:bifunctional 4-hydroxy-2-oxoglutarate aldolase/2-dehydro-3-deoxy-phosphogluconate aldolase [Bauldia sp.]
MGEKEERLVRVLTAAPVVPVLTIEDRATAVPLARALVAGGLTALEVTLRTAAGLDCIRAIKAEVEGCNVGAGTVLDARQMEEAAAAGATFMVSPGVSPRLLAAARDCPAPFLPGVATAGEAMALAEEGMTILKFFPAEPAGGIAYLKALSAPLPGIRFCPTGGVGPKNAADYLALGNVICVGGSWVAPGEAVALGNWTRITALSKEASQLGRSHNAVY